MVWTWLACCWMSSSFWGHVPWSCLGLVSLLSLAAVPNFSPAVHKRGCWFLLLLWPLQRSPRMIALTAFSGPASTSPIVPCILDRLEFRAGLLHKANTLLPPLDTLRLRVFRHTFRRPFCCSKTGSRRTSSISRKSGSAVPVTRNELDGMKRLFVPSPSDLAICRTSMI